MYWFLIGLHAQPRLTHLNINEASFLARFLWFHADTRPYYVNYTSYTVNAFHGQVENGLEKCFLSAFFPGFNAVWHIMIAVVHTLVATQLFKSSIGEIET